MLHPPAVVFTVAAGGLGASSGLEVAGIAGSLVFGVLTASAAFYAILRGVRESNQSNFDRGRNSLSDALAECRKEVENQRRRADRNETRYLNLLEKMRRAEGGEHDE